LWFSFYRWKILSLYFDKKIVAHYSNVEAVHDFFQSVSGLRIPLIQCDGQVFSPSVPVRWFVAFFPNILVAFFYLLVAMYLKGLIEWEITSTCSICEINFRNLGYFFHNLT
jgi:hypothetical protein